MLFFLISAFGFLGVALGAFGEHMLASQLSSSAFKTFSTAVTYHQLYSVLLLVLALLYTYFPKKKLVTPVLIACFFGSTFVFSGSLYLYLLTDLRFFIYITPVGGFGLILSWLYLGFKGLRAL